MTNTDDAAEAEAIEASRLGGRGFEHRMADLVSAVADLEAEARTCSKLTHESLRVHVDQIRARCLAVMEAAEELPLTSRTWRGLALVGWAVVALFVLASVIR